MRTAPAIVLITAFAALSSIGDTFAAGNIVAVPPAEYRPSAVVPKAAACAGRTGCTGVPTGAACTQRRRARIAQGAERQARRAASGGAAHIDQESSARHRLSARAAVRVAHDRALRPRVEGAAGRRPRRPYRDRLAGCRGAAAVAVDARGTSRPLVALRRQLAARGGAGRLSRERGRRGVGAARCVLVAGAGRRHGDDRGARGRRGVVRRARAGTRTAVASRHRRRRPAPDRRQARGRHRGLGQLQHRPRLYQPVDGADPGGGRGGQAAVQRSLGLDVPVQRHDAERLGDVVHPLPVHRRPLHRGRLQRRDGERLLVLPRAVLRQHLGASLRTADRRLDAARAKRRLRLDDAPPVHVAARGRALRRLARRAGADQCDRHRAASPRRRSPQVEPGLDARLLHVRATARASCRCAGATARRRPDRPARACSRSCRRAATTSCAAACSAATRRAATAPASTTTRDSTTCCR